MEKDKAHDIREGGSPADTRLDSNGKTQTTSDYALIVSGDVYEIYHRIEKPFILNRKPTGTRKKRKSGEGTIRHLEYRARNANRIFNNLRRLIHSNFDVGAKFITLTFADSKYFDITNLPECYKRVSLFTKKLRQTYTDLKYIIKPEFQKRGALHYHVITDLPFTEKEELASLWGYGFVDIRLIKDKRQLGAYISKYIGKDINDKRFERHKSYYTSKNLNKPKKYYGDEAINFVKNVRENKIKPNFESFYKNEYSGTTEFEEYDLSAPEYYE